jgi:hypothetical protein
MGLKMKKYIFGLIFISQILIAQNGLAPVLGMRFDINDMQTAKQVVGVQINFDEGKYSGFDTDGEYSRIFMGMSYAKLGIGSALDDNGDQIAIITVGATYNISGALNTDIEYVYNQNNASAGGLRVAIGLQF